MAIISKMYTSGFPFSWGGHTTAVCPLLFNSGWNGHRIVFLFWSIIGTESQAAKGTEVDSTGNDLRWSHGATTTPYPSLPW